MTDLPLSDELAALPAPWGSVVAALQAIDRLSDAMLEALTALRDDNKQIHAEMAELRDELNTRALKAVPS